MGTQGLEGQQDPPVRHKGTPAFKVLKVTKATRVYKVFKEPLVPKVRKGSPG